MKLSVVVPVYNEEGNVTSLHKEILAAVRTVTSNFEIIFVNDASTDGTLRALKKLKPITILNFGRNTGQSAALKAGFDYASGDVIVSLDGDGQNDPAAIPAMVRMLLKENLDCVSGWRKDRKDAWYKTLPSHFGVWLHHLVIDDKVHDSGCTLKAYKAWAVKDLELYGETHRYLPALLSLRGAKIGEMVVKHRPRTAGRSKYGPWKIMKGLIDLFIMWFWQKFAARPVHLMGYLSLLTGAFGVFCGVLSAWLKWGPEHKDLSDTFLPNVGFFSILIAIQLFITGILMDIAIRTYYQKKYPYHVREIIKKT